MNQEGDKKKKTEQKISRKEAAEEKNKLNAPMLVHEKKSTLNRTSRRQGQHTLEAIQKELISTQAKVNR